MYLSLNKWHLRQRQAPYASELWNSRVIPSILSVWYLGKIVTWGSNSWVSSRYCCTLQGLPHIVWLRDNFSSPTASAAPGRDVKLQQEGLGTATGQSTLQANHALLTWVSHLYHRHNSKLHTARASFCYGCGAWQPLSNSSYGSLQHCVVLKVLDLTLAGICSSIGPQLITNN